jgi:1-acyl-sn-glycerol-3-phosphate acyltransferase
VDFQFLAKRRLADYPLIGTVIRKAGHITIDKATLTRQLAGADMLPHLLAEGRRLLIFPEGTFFRPPGLLPFRLGAFKTAVEARCAVVPIALRGTRTVLPDGTWLFRRAPIDITIGTPLVPQEQGWPEMVRLRDEARNVIARGSANHSAPDAAARSVHPCTRNAAIMDASVGAARRTRFPLLSTPAIVGASR